MDLHVSTHVCAFGFFFSATVWKICIVSFQSFESAPARNVRCTCRSDIWSASGKYCIRKVCMRYGVVYAWWHYWTAFAFHYVLKGRLSVSRLRGRDTVSFGMILKLLVWTCDKLSAIMLRFLCYISLMLCIWIRYGHKKGVWFNNCICFSCRNDERLGT